MVVNMVLPGAGSCGGTRMAFLYLNYLVRCGHDVVCYVPLTGSYHGWKKILFPKLMYLQMTRPEMRGSWFEKNFELKFPMWINNKDVRNADVTIATSWITAYWIEKLSNAKGKKLYFIQGFETWGTEKTNKKVRESYKLPFDERVVVSTALHHRILREIGKESNIVCNGLQQKYIGGTKAVKNRICLGMPYRMNSRPLTDVKNCELGLYVLQELCKQNPQVYAVSYGFEKPDDWPKEVRFLENPTREQLTELYDEIDIFYVPSLYEGWGLPAMEAMARQCAVVAANSGAIFEFGRDGENCRFLDEPNNFKKTVQIIQELIDLPDFSRKIGINAQNTIKKYTFEENAAKFERVISMTVNGTNNAQ